MTCNNCQEEPDLRQPQSDISRTHLKKYMNEGNLSNLEKPLFLENETEYFYLYLGGSLTCADKAKARFDLRC